MNCSFDWPSWITATATAATMFAAGASWWVSRKLFLLQNSIQEAAKPKVFVWVNSKGSRPEHGSPLPDASLTLINLGVSALAIRTLRLLSGYRTTQAPSVIRTLGYFASETDKVSFSANDQNNQVTSDLILPQNQVFLLRFIPDHVQFHLEVMYFDNTFEFINIDSSNLGGKYIITGEGRKP